MENIQELIDVFGLSESLLEIENGLISYRGDIEINALTSIRAKTYSKNINNYKFDNVYGNFKISDIEIKSLPKFSKTLTFVDYTFENLEFLKDVEAVEIIFIYCKIKPSLKYLYRDLKSLRFQYCKILNLSDIPENLKILLFGQSEIYMEDDKFDFQSIEYCNHPKAKLKDFKSINCCDDYDNVNDYIFQNVLNLKVLEYLKGF